METALEADVVLADRYRLVAPIGRGGYSVVWIADHVVTGKRVALKVLTKRGDEPASRFLREARITARIDHPDVVNIHDVFQIDESDALVMVMDLLEGVSLAERLRSSHTVRLLQGGQEFFPALVRAPEHGARIDAERRRTHFDAPRPPGPISWISQIL